MSAVALQCEQYSGKRHGRLRITSSFYAVSLKFAACCSSQAESQSKCRMVQTYKPRVGEGERMSLSVLAVQVLPVK
jgi:hypothetical protein